MEIFVPVVSEAWSIEEDFLAEVLPTYFASFNNSLHEIVLGYQYLVQLAIFSISGVKLSEENMVDPVLLK